MSTIDLINNIKNDNNVDAEKAFNSTMADVISTALDAKKIEVASNLFTGTPDAVEAIEADEDEVSTEEDQG
jgi:hypothetical protein